MRIVKANLLRSLSSLVAALNLFCGVADASTNETQKLTASDAEPADVFGLTVSVSGDSAIVGARV